MKKFRPTNNDIVLAVKLFIAKSLVEVMIPAFEKIEQDILNEGSYRIDPKNAKNYKERGYESDIIKDRARIYMMDGIEEACDNSNSDKDAGRYYRELSIRTYKAGFVNKENSLAIAEHNVIKLENEFMKACDKYSNIDSDIITLLDHRKKYIELNMQLFARNVEIYPDREIMTKKYFSEHISSN